MDDNASIIKRINIPLTDGQLESYIGVKPEDIIKYADLKNYNSITDLLPDKSDFRIILIEQKFNSGHWVCILRNGNNIEYFNSYGAKYDTDWKFISRMIRICLGEETNEMTRLMNQAEKDGFKTSFNKFRFQKLANNIQTCGRHCIFRIECFKMGYDNDQYKELVNKLKNTADQEVGGASADYVVAKYVKA